MKNYRMINIRFILLLGFGIITLSSCERSFSDDVEFAEFPANGDIFLDAPVGITNQFFESFDPATGANPEGFGTDDNVAFQGTTSIRIDVPAPDDPDGPFIGGIFRDRGAGRNLTGFDALTFYARGSTTATIGEVGFGTDFGENRFAVVARDIRLSTDWRKIVIPIPDASKLVQERGMFLFSAGTQSTGGFGFTFWIDELRFEKLGTIGQPSPAIFDGQDIVSETFNGSEFVITGLTQTFNLESGINQTVSAAPAYYDFASSDNSVAIVDGSGVVTVIGEGTSNITAQLASVGASGSLAVTSTGTLPTAPTPMVPAADVSSLFSNAYANAVEIDVNPGFGGSTTSTQIFSNEGDDVLIYANNNFTGIILNNTLDASARTTLNIDVYVQDAATSVEVQIRDVGANQELETNVFNGLPEGDDVDRRFTISGLTPGEWTSIQIPLDGDLAAQRNNLGALILAGGPNFIFDNIYFFTE